MALFIVFRLLFVLRNLHFTVFVVLVMEPYSAFHQRSHQRPLGIALLCSRPQSCGTANGPT